MVKKVGKEEQAKALSRVNNDHRVKICGRKECPNTCQREARAQVSSASLRGGL